MQGENFSIGELARHFNITTRSIRFYEEQGLISPKRNGNNRLYSKKDKVRLQLILRGKRLGFSLAETQTLFALYDDHPNSQVQLEVMLEMTQSKRQLIQQKLDDIHTLITELDEVEFRCQQELQDLKTSS
jgi:DNA-binding transcriptional MerR regulator